MGHRIYQPSIGSMPGIHWMGDSWSLRKKDIDQVKILWASWRIWGTKVHFMVHPNFIIPNTEIFFSEAPVGSHRSWKNEKANSYYPERSFRSWSQNLSRYHHYHHHVTTILCYHIIPLLFMDHHLHYVNHILFMYIITSYNSIPTEYQ